MGRISTATQPQIAVHDLNAVATTAIELHTKQFTRPTAIELHTKLFT
jgi:hypothetical protein